MRGRPWAVWLALVVAVSACWGLARAGDSSGDTLTPWNPCNDCNLLVGVGTTYKFWGWTDGLVLPIELEFDDSRWELGAFRMASGQLLSEPKLFPHTPYAALPYWGFTAMRRWQVVHRPWGKIYLGFGANYKTETDYLDSTLWNFAYLIAARFDLHGENTFVELGVRHWSNAWLRLPDRGQNLMTITFGF
ncbi:MAG: hypothetical protein WBE92_18635 [Steroidobacteraceae bacterium]